MMKKLLTMMTVMLSSMAMWAGDNDPITFADSAVKTICVANWDTSGDGELSEAEAAAVTDLGTVFKKNTEITSFSELQYFSGLTSIFDYVFYNCSNLTTVTIPQNVYHIGFGAFYGCSSLSSISIPSNVKLIYTNAFSGCSSLSTITFPDSYIDYGQNVFEGSAWYENQADGLIYAGKVLYNYKGTMPSNTSVVVQEGTVAIRMSAFYGQNNLVSVSIPAVDLIGNSAFYGCTNLASVTIAAGTKAISEGAFRDCTSLTEITLPSSITLIDFGAFENCTSLTSVTALMETPVSIDSWTFSERMYATLYVPAGCKAAYQAADYWKDFGSIVEMAPSSPIIEFADANVKEICVANWDTSGDGELSEAEAAAVTDLGFVFSCNENIISFDELQYFTGLSSVIEYAFASCVGLKTISLPNSVTTIGQGSFSGCSSLTSMTIPEGVTSIAADLFSDCI